MIKGEKKPSHSSGTKSRIKEKGFLGKLRRQKIPQTLAAFIGGGWLIIEVVHWVLIDHYHIPEEWLDVTIVTLAATLLITLTWRWFREGKKRSRRLKAEFFVIPLIVIAAGVLNIHFIRLIQHHEAVSSETSSSLPEVWTNSIAVLPFADLSPQGDQEYFCDGLTEELINALTKIQGLKVMARTSAFAFKGKKDDIREIGRKLGVKTVLEGSVRRSDSLLRVTAQLINVEDGFHLWSEKYDRELSDIFAIQDDIALAIMHKLRLEFSNRDVERVTERQTLMIEAHDAYLRGNYFLRSRTEEGIRSAIQAFNQALTIDPEYASAYAGLANAFTLVQDYAIAPPHELLEKAREAAKKALSLDENLAEAYTAYGLVIQYCDWDWVGAEKAFLKALALNPGFADAHYYYGHMLFRLGRHREAIEAIRTAIELDPYSMIYQRNLGMAYLAARDFDAAIEQLEKAAEMDPEFPLVMTLLGHCYASLSMWPEAEKAFAEDRTLPRWQTEYFLAVIESHKGDPSKLGKHHQEYFQALSLFSPYWVAVFEAELGNVENMYLWLTKAVEKKDNWLSYINVLPYFDRFHSEPRFKDILKKIGFTGY